MYSYLENYHLGALEYAHSQGTVHRDVKPSNILLDQSGAAYLTDFGIAKLQRGKRFTTQYGLRLGTPHYMSPEQIRNSSMVDHRSDVYSFGCVLYEMLTGEPPFDGETDDAVLFGHLERSPDPPSRKDPGISPEVDKVVLCSLAKNKEERFESCAAMLAALEGALQQPEPPVKIAYDDPLKKTLRQDLGGPGSTQQIEQKRVARPGLTRWPAWLVGALVLAVGLGYWLIDGNSAVPEIESFGVEPMAIKAGQSATLIWKTKNADTVDITPDFLDLAKNGSQEVKPLASASYRLVARNKHGSATAILRVDVGVGVRDVEVTGGAFLFLRPMSVRI